MGLLPKCDFWTKLLTKANDSILTAVEPTLPYRIQPVLAPSGDVALPDYARRGQLRWQGLLGQDNYLRTSTYQTLHFGQPAYAYGWRVGQLAATGAPVSTHDGSVGTFFCHTNIYPSERVAFVVITNAGGAAAE